jgi:hypothetical protein
MPVSNHKIYWQHEFQSAATVAMEEKQREIARCGAAAAVVSQGQIQLHGSYAILEKACTSALF